MPGATYPIMNPSINLQESTDITPISFNSGSTIFEFLIFMIPCYLFIIVSIRKIRILNRTTANSGVHKQNSYYIKKALLLLHVFIFILQLVLAAVQKKEIYWVAEYRSGTIVYLFGVLAWVLSMKLLDKEVRRGLPQQYFEQRMFWILNFIVAVIKVMNPIEQNLCPLIINLLKIFAGLWLTLYAIAKPFDSDEADDANGNSNPVSFIRSLLISIEELQCTKSLVGEIDYEKGEALLFSGRNSEHEEFADEFKNFMKQHNIKETTTAQAGDWLKYLPVVSCSISKNVVAKEEGAGKVKVFYEVKTKVEDEIYETLHNYKDFLNLEEYIKKRCDPSKVSWIDRSSPEFEKVEVSNYANEKAFINARIEILERYLNTLGADPRYMNDEVIKFMGIEDPHKSAFLKYIAYLATSAKKKNQTGITPGFELGEMSTSQKKKKEVEVHIPSLKVKFSHFQKSIYGDHYEYILVVTDEKEPENSWSLVKSYGDFKTFHDKLEKILNKSIPYLGQYVPKPLNQKQTMEPAFVEKRKQGLESYINTILRQPAYHNSPLYEFLEYDVKRGIHSSRANTPRDSDA